MVTNEKFRPLLEAVKEPLRLLVLAIIPFGLSYFELFNTEWATIIVVVLRFLDKALHEYGKQNRSEALKLGVTRF